MHNKWLFFIGFAFMIGLQWYVPFQMIQSKERVLREGKVYAFACAPVDPVDPFRGKYVQLQFEANMLRFPKSSDWKYGEPIYVHLESGANGFAQIADASREPPPPEVDYLEAFVDYAYYSSVTDSVEITIQYPFDRFYLEESRAKPAEDLYQLSMQTDSVSTYALVSVLDGRGVLRDVQMDGKSIQEWAGKEVINE